MNELSFHNVCGANLGALALQGVLGLGRLYARGAVP